MGFGSTATDYVALFGLAFASAPLSVSLAGSIACGRTISGLFHSASSGSFRLSLAVLVRYRSSASV